MTREDFCNKIEVKCFECGEMCDKYNNAECVEDLCKKNLVAEFESEIRADEREKTIEEIKIRTISEVFERYKGKNGYFDLGKSIQQQLFEELIEELKGDAEK